MDTDHLKKKFVSVHPHAPKRLSLFTIEITQQCNFRCAYCCFSGLYKERRAHNPLSMSQKNMTKTLDFILKNRCADRLTIVTFYGGESLLALPKIKWFVEQLRINLGKDVGFSISSNGYLLNPETIHWLCSVDDCQIYITIDGYQKLHDKNRKTVNGSPTYQTILTNLKYFRKNFPEEYEKRVRFLVTLSSWKELVSVSEEWNKNSFLKTTLPTHLSFILPKSLDEMLHPTSSMDERKSVLDLALQMYKHGENNFLVSQFVKWTDDYTRNMKYKETGDKVTIYTCLEDMYRTFISAEGDIYICERFSSDYKIGHILYGINESQLLSIENNYIERRNRICVDCPAYATCSMCMTSLNYSDQELSALCKIEQEMSTLMSEYQWKRRMFDREVQLHDKH